MSKAFRLIIVLILATSNFSFVFCQQHGAPKITHRPRKSGARTRSFKINLPQKTFELRDRKAFGIADIYSEKFLKEIESHMQNPESLGAQQWQAAVETRPRKKEKILEPDQKSKQEKKFDMLRSEELNNLVKTTKTQKNPQKETHQLKEKTRKEKPNKKDRKKKKEESSSSESPEQIMSKELKSEQIRNDHLPKSSQTAVAEKSNLRGGKHHHSELLTRHRDHQNYKHNNHCVKKCYIPKCKVECKGRQGSAACSANKCKASTRGEDSAAVCKGDKCAGQCTKSECIAACEGNYCSVKCIGNICHAVCVGDFCVSFSKGNGSKPRCEGRECQTWCVGDNCFAKCHGSHCEAMCSGKNCKAECVGKNCTKFHYIGMPPVPDKPWVLDSDSNDVSDTKLLDTTTSSKSQDTSISISNESGVKSILAAEKNKVKDVNDGYYGNKVHIKNTLIKDVSNNNGYFVNTGNNVNKYTYDKKDNVTIDYDIVVEIGKKFGDFIKQKVAQLQDLSLLELLPSLL